MAELVDDDVVAQARGQEEQLVAEIKIGFAGTAAPTPLLIPDRHAIPGETVVLIKVVEPFGNRHAIPGETANAREVKAIAY